MCKSDIRIDELYYFVFGISIDEKDSDKKIEKCINKAYLDICRTIDYRLNSDESKKDKEFEKLKISFIKEINDKLKSELGFIDEKDLDRIDFDMRHKKLTESIQSVSKKYKKKELFKEECEECKECTGLSIGQIAKLINMTLKYLRIMGEIPCELDNYLHVPIDDYIISAAKMPKDKKIHETFDVKGLGVSINKKWSNIDEYGSYESDDVYGENYMSYQKQIRNSLKNSGMFPIEWESIAWMAEATRRSNQ